MARPGLVPSMVCVKNLILGLSCLLVMTGMLLIAVGSTILGVYSTFDVIISNDLVSPATFLIFTGSVIFAIALFGCVGAIKESTCLINMYTMFLILVFVFELAAGIAGFVMQSTVSGILTRNFNDAIQHHYTNDESVLKAIDGLQSQIGCCGGDSPDDWAGVLSNATYDLLQGDVIVPNSCCGRWNDTQQMPECEQPYTEGCLETLIDVAKSGAVLLTGAAITVSLIQAMSVYFSNELAKAIRESKSQRTLRQMQIREQLVSSYLPMNKDGTTNAPVVPVIYLADVAEVPSTAT